MNCGKQSMHAVYHTKSRAQYRYDCHRVVCNHLLIGKLKRSLYLHRLGRDFLKRLLVVAVVTNRVEMLVLHIEANGKDLNGKFKP